MTTRPVPNLIELLPLDSMFINDTYQRDPSQKHVGKIIDGFDENLVGVLMVSPRDDGGYWVWDGQHRVIALNELGYEQWYCNLSHLSLREQAEAFVEANGTHRGMSALDRHHAALSYNEPHAVGVEMAVEDAGLYIGKGGVTSVKSCYSAIERFDARALTRGLKTLRRVWPRSNRAFAGALIGGASEYMGLNPSRSMMSVVEAMRTAVDDKGVQLTPGGFVGLAQYQAGATGGSKGHQQAELIGRLVAAHAG